MRRCSRARPTIRSISRRSASAASHRIGPRRWNGTVRRPRSAMRRRRAGPTSCAASPSNDMTETGKDGMLYRNLMIVAGLIVAAFCATATAAQPSGDLKAQANRGTIGVISGGIDGTYIRIAADLSAVLEEPNTLRILPVLGKGSVQNVADLLYLRGIDVGIVQSDVLAYVKRDKAYSGIERRLQYIAKLYNEEFHLLAGKDVGSVADLAGQKGNLDVRGS